MGIGQEMPNRIKILSSVARHLEYSGSYELCEKMH